MKLNESRPSSHLADVSGSAPGQPNQDQSIPAGSGTIPSSLSKTFWLTGLSGAGKSTLASGMVSILLAEGVPAYAVDGDVMRRGLCKDLGFSPEERSENIRRIAEVSRILNEAGVMVLVAAISPLASDRALARDIIGADRFFEIYVKADLETCIGRDPKGLYARALRGEIKDFTGISAAYHAPESAALVIETGALTFEQSLKRLGSFLHSQAADPIVE